MTEFVKQSLPMEAEGVAEMSQPDPNWTDNKIGGPIAGAFVVAELSPLNELARLSAFGAAQTAFRDPTVSAAVYAAATFAIETAGAYATADLMESRFGHKTLAKVSAGLEKLDLTGRIHTNTPLEFAVGMVAGTPMTQTIKQLQHPERSRSENRRYGVAMSLGLTAACGAQAYLVSKGINHPSVSSVAEGAGAVGAVFGLGKWSIKRIRKSQQAGETLDQISGDEFDDNAGTVRYDLSPEEIEALETSMSEEVRERFGDKEDLYTLWIRPDHEYADIVRTHETEFWPDMEKIMAEHEEESLFLALFDTRKGLNKVVHGTRVSRPRTSIESQDDEQTGLIVIDDVINSGQDFTAQEFRDYYASRNFDLSKSFTVESNLRIRHTDKYNGLSVADVGYLSIFKMLERSNVGTDESGVFASINTLSANSLEDAGVEFEPLVGRADLKTPLADGKFAEDYELVCLPTSKKNLELFRSLDELAAPEIDI
jgi:hypothetical protein